MLNKYTAIYVESWVSGSHTHTITRYKRFTQDTETQTVMAAALEDGGIEPDTIVYLFVGWPALEGEVNENL
jgi:hypothetical protein